MKTSLVILALILSASVRAGTCHLVLNSNETGKLPFSGTIKENHERVELDDCLRLAENELGTKRTMKTMLREATRTVTDINYKFTSKDLSSEGTLTSKAK